MRIAIPHSLGREEARRRLQEKSGGIGEMMPAGLAQVAVTWPHQDQMNLDVTAMGKSIAGAIEIADDHVAFTIELPTALAFIEPMVRGAIEQKGTRLLT
jgi:hypothetical protein